MTLTKFNKNRFPMFNDRFSNWLDTNDFLSDDFFTNRESIPAMNVKENLENFEIELAVPGFSKKDIKVTIENDILQVSGEKSFEKVDEKDDGYTRKEFSSNSFSRNVSLPTVADSKKDVKAAYKDGILKLTVQKEAQEKIASKKTIEIQ